MPIITSNEPKFSKPVSAGPRLIPIAGGAGASATDHMPGPKTKKEMAKEAEKTALGSLREFAKSKPSKSTMREYIKTRMEELNEDEAS